MEKEPLSMQKLINILYNMDDVQCIPVKNGAELLQKASGLRPDNPAFKYLEFTHYGYAMMEENGVSTTQYGLVRRNEKELVLECQPSIGQQMM